MIFGVIAIATHLACGPGCQMWRSGHGAPIGRPTKCYVHVVAPTYGGKAALDVRKLSHGKFVSVWGGPRIKPVKPGVLEYKVGCNWLEQPSVEAYLCIDGGPGRQFSSIRWRPDIDEALRAHRLEMCLKGEECPGYAPGPLPPH